MVTRHQSLKLHGGISLELDQLVARIKPRHDTIDDFIKKVFEQWIEWKETIPFMEEAYEKQSKVIEGYVKQILELKQEQQLTTTTSKSIL